jgi:hypothetical protein
MRQSESDYNINGNTGRHNHVTGLNAARAAAAAAIPVDPSRDVPIGDTRQSRQSAFYLTSSLQPVAGVRDY